MGQRRLVCFLAAIFLLPLLAAGLAACGQASPSPGSQALDYTLLVAHLRATGAAVTEQGTADTTMGLSGHGRDIFLNGARVAVYEYDSADAATADAQHISADGSTFTYQGSFGNSHSVIVDFVAPPHWYHGGRILVLYVGVDASIQALLAQQLGQPFAGQEHF